jgi:hypothetical protein
MALRAPLRFPPPKILPHAECVISPPGPVLPQVGGPQVAVPRPEALLAKAGESYPAAASNYIREHHLPQPLFNAFEWGGFLTWYLPEYPVAIDGRTDLYGDDFIIEYSKVMNAEVRYTDFPALANARTILLPKTAIIGEALSSVPVFKVAYSDDVAVVLTRDTGTE